jgi:hypothetical protein
MFATLVAAGALFALPTASQAGGFHKLDDCLFGWMKRDHHHAVVKGAVYKKKAVKVKKAKKVAARPMK